MYLLPLVSTLFSGIFSGSMLARYYGQRGSAIINVLCLFVAFISSLIMWYEVVFASCEVFVDLFGTWFTVGSFNVYWALYFDLTTVHLLLTVTSVSFAVHCYALVYMKADPHLNLFMCYLSLFTFFMCVLVTGQDLILMLVGWEGIGVCSYLLIGYWSHRLSASKSALKAVVVNRLSDGLLLWGVLWIWWNTGSLEYDLITLSYCSFDNFAASATESSAFLSTAILVGAMGKSAQIGFHVWLADAMEGPTPVSALIHAATLVCAGVYVMVRLSIFYDDLIIVIGSLTALMAGIFGFFQADLKRVIAFSTCSQLGYMMVSVGLGEFGADASICHLMTHASFKAALFLSAGVIIMAAGGSNQHMARFGGLSAVHCSLFCFVTLLIACLCLMGMPETSGFYSKETIINYSYVCFNPLADYAHTLLILAALITCSYTVKLFIQSFLYDFSGNDFNISGISPNTHFLIGIAFTVLLSDIVFKIWTGTNLLSGILFFIPWGVKTLPVGLMIAGFLTATAAVTSQQFGIMRFCATRWGFDQLYARTLVNLVLDLGRITWFTGDKGLFIMNDQKIHM
jgi:proton-translocating NADH-quinone oxidoreductase chain L